MKNGQRKHFYRGRIFLIFLLSILLGSTGCSDILTGEDEQQEISVGMDAVGADMDTEEKQSLRQSQIQDENAEGTDGSQDENLEIHFIDVGQGDAALLICGGEAMLIDAGNNDQGTNVQNYLQKQNVETLKYVICTHLDADHIGGIDVILYKFNCETVFMTGEEKDTETYRDVIDTMKNKGYKAIAPAVGQQYSLGDAEFVITGPDSEAGREGNDNSIAILVSHGENRFLFTGDAEEEEESEMIQGAISLQADVYKVGHHGSRTSSSKALLEAVQPTYAVISCGEGNSYGHPHAETLNNLRAMGVKVFRTDEQGSILLTSDGQEITWNCSPSETWTPGEPTGGSGEPQPGEPLTGEPLTGEPLSGEPLPGEPLPGEPLLGESQPGESQSGESVLGEPQLGEVQLGESSSGISEGESEELPSGQELDESSPAASAQEEISYICNTNTMKFHYPDCSSVDQMKESNKLPVSATREELISQGYVPCKRCKP